MMSKNKIDPEFMPENTRLVFNTLASKPFIKKFSLIGGTALSLQIHHRLSEDLDFIFDGEKLPLSLITNNVLKTFSDARIVRQDNSYQIDFVVNNVRLTFFSGESALIFFPVIEHTFCYQNINIANYTIIGSLKLAAIAQRNTIRDYFDLYWLTKNYLSLESLIEQTKKLIPGLSPITYTETLIYTKDIEEYSISDHLAPAITITKEDISDFFISELRNIYKSG